MTNSFLTFLRGATLPHILFHNGTLHYSNRLPTKVLCAVAARTCQAFRISSKTTCGTLFLDQSTMIKGSWKRNACHLISPSAKRLASRNFFAFTSSAPLISFARAFGVPQPLIIRSPNSSRQGCDPATSPGRGLRLRLQGKRQAYRCLRCRCSRQHHTGTTPVRDSSGAARASKSPLIAHTRVIVIPTM